MKQRLYYEIAARIVLLFLIAMLSTYIPEIPQLKLFFGDSFIPNGEHTYEHTEWGVRHYWFFWIMMFLFILSLINTVASVYNLVRKYHPNFKI